MTDTESFIRGMPKAELHVHIEGTLEPEQRFEFAKRNGIELPYKNIDELKAASDFKDLSGFLALYYDGLEVIRTEQDFFDLTYAYLQRMNEQNVVYTEIHFDPQPHTSRGIAFDTIIKGIRRAQEDAQDDFCVRSQLIMAFNRERSVESAMAALERSFEYKDWIVGVGLDSEEQGNPPVKFKGVFERARAEGYRLTMHCDQNQKNSVQHIWQCLNEINVDRIDHGVNAIDDDRLAREIVRRGTCLTVCPTSTPSHPSPRRVNELQTMFHMGMNVTVNTDDPAYMLSNYMNEVLINTQKALNLTQEQVLQLTRNAFRSAWITQDEIDDYLAALQAYIS